MGPRDASVRRPSYILEHMFDPVLRTDESRDDPVLRTDASRQDAAAIVAFISRS